MPGLGHPVHKEQDPRTPRLYAIAAEEGLLGPHLRLLVDREVVEDDDIARAQRRHQDLFDVGEERRTINGPIKHRGCAQPLKTKRGNHCVGLPVTARGVIAEPGPSRAAPVAA